MSDLTCEALKNSKIPSGASAREYPFLAVFDYKNNAFPRRMLFKRISIKALSWLNSECELLTDFSIKEVKKAALTVHDIFDFDGSHVFGRAERNEKNEDEYLLFDCGESDEKAGTLDVTVYYRTIDPSKFFEPYQRGIDMAGIFLLCRGSYGQLYLREYDVGDLKIDLPMNYGPKFVPVHEKIVAKLNKIDGGLYMFYGPPGTGKTSYLRHLCRLIEERTFIFIPPSMTNNLSDSSFLSLMSGHNRPVLIIEDAEEIMASREENKGWAGIASSILNITDGILTSVTKASIVTTYNTQREKIDPAFLRKGRLKIEYEFNNLSIEDSDALLTRLGVEEKAKQPMTLADIFNLKEEVSFSDKEKNERKIGFV